MAEMKPEETTKQEDVLVNYTIPKIRLIGDTMLCTLKTQKVTKGGIILSDSELGEPYTRQTVLVSGSSAFAKPGEDVEINFDLFPTTSVPPEHGVGPDKHRVILPVVTIDKEHYFFLSTRFIKWIYEDA